MPRKQCVQTPEGCPTLSRGRSKFAETAQRSHEIEQILSFYGGVFVLASWGVQRESRQRVQLLHTATRWRFMSRSVLMRGNTLFVCFLKTHLKSLIAESLPLGLLVITQ